MQIPAMPTTSLLTKTMYRRHGVGLTPLLLLALLLLMLLQEVDLFPMQFSSCCGLAD